MAAVELSYKEFDPTFIKSVEYAKRPAGNQKTKKPRDIKNLLCAFDIECSRLPDTEFAFVYHWQMQIGEYTIFGRNPAEWKNLMDKISAVLTENETIYLFVHNLSYEFHNIIRLCYPDITNNDLFCTGPRKVVKCKLYEGRIEMRCSYILTNLSLAAFTKQMNVEHKKLDSEEFDHTKIRYPWTDLSEIELEYCRNDVLGLTEALKRQLEIYNDTLATIPLPRRAMLDVMCGALWKIGVITGCRLSNLPRRYT